MTMGKSDASRIRRTPTILQMEASECGAAALAMVLAHHGRWESLEQLRMLCGVSRDGSKAVNILKAARSLGLDAKGMRLEPADLAHIPLPAILFVDMNHFVVLEGRRGDGFQLNDPAVGRRRVGREEFDAMFSGIALVFAPGPEFRRQGTPRGVLRTLLDTTRGSGTALWAAAVCSALLGGFAMLGPALNRIFVDYPLLGNPPGWLDALVLAALAAGALAGALYWLRARLLARLHVKLSLVLGSRLAWHILRLPSSFFSQRHGGMISARLPLAEQIARFASHYAARLILSLSALAFFSVLMLQYHPPLAALCLLIAALNAALFAMLQHRLGDAAQQQALQAMKMEGELMQGIQSIETLKATGADDLFFSRWSGLQALLANARQGAARRQALADALPVLTAAISAALVLSMGGAYVIQGGMSVGMLVAFMVVLGLLPFPMQELMAVARAVHGARGPLAQIDDTLRHPLAKEFAPSVDTPGAGAPGATRQALRLSGRIGLRQVTVGYSPLDPPLIQQLDLDIPAGARIAIVGPSGSGKSTIARVLSGMLAPWDGDLSFDGRPIADIPRALLRQSLSVVDQDIVLFEGTVRDNLSLWDATLPIDQIVQAAKDAMIHDVIMSRRGGYDGPVEENGRNFSGGQRQRLEIARALAGNPSVLILDEATSALDTVTEQAIITNLRRRGCTCIIIAHRLSTIRDCDQILVLHQGRIVERGTHEQLMRMEGAYRGLVEY